MTIKNRIAILRISLDCMFIFRYFLAQRYKLFSNSPNFHSKMVEGIFLQYIILQKELQENKCHRHV